MDVGRRPEIKVEDKNNVIQGSHDRRMDVDRLAPGDQVGDGSSSYIVPVIPLATPST